MKQALRREARTRLRALIPGERERFGVEIARRVWTLPEVAAARTLLLYASLPEEVPTDEIASAARERGVEVIYPRCLPGQHLLALHRTQGLDDLRQGEYGIREPAPDCPLVEIAEIDVAFLPGLAWSRDGARLGRGAGYYDRLLAAPEWQAFRCGLFFAAQEFPEIPTDPWDIPLDAVVTEREVWHI